MVIIRQHEKNAFVKKTNKKCGEDKFCSLRIQNGIGYLIGLLGKLITWRKTGVWAYSIWFYLADIAMVLIDMALYLRNTALDRKHEQ